MPRPWSSNTSRIPWRLPSSTASIRTVPPPPWIRVLRASSLAAVTSLVWSTRLNRNSTAHPRTAWRTATTSDSERMGRDSNRRGGIDVAPGEFHVGVQGGPQQLHAALHVQRRAHPGEREPQLDEGD